MRLLLLASLALGTAGAWTFAARIVPPPDAEEGRVLYQQFCASCHGKDLTGGNAGGFLDDTWAVGKTREARRGVIHDGIANLGMPAFGDALTSDQITSLLDFIDAVRDGSMNPLAAASAPADTLETLDYTLLAETFVDGVDAPWAIAFLDDRTALVTEIGGALRVVKDGILAPEPVQGTPRVLAAGQGGLLDVTPDPDYASNGWIYLAYSHALDPAAERSPSMTRVVRGKLRGNVWMDEEVLFEAPHDTYRTTRHHYGTRLVFDPEGHLYFSIGDRGTGENAQDLSRPNGKIHRINRDGSIPTDNPFVNTPGALPSVFSYGHRNPQGLTVHPQTGAVWAVEHGPKGGDELNIVRKGANYGWPTITYGINYNGTIITDQRRAPGMEQPVVYWKPSIAVAGAEFYTGNAFPYWTNQLLVTALAFEEVRVLTLDGDRVLHQEIILKDAGRVREAVPGPDGAIYVVLNEPDRILRLSPRARL